ncbi:hypothetical protein [Flavicella sp.]|uniref:hypothetical protein n=1 Tax=Flavicella sp. TaxID=2957742 RepID=UPI00301951AB
MHKIVHTDFELDLSTCEIEIVEDNYWFSDQFFTKYSFPFTIHLEGDLLKAFNYLLEDNNTTKNYFFEVTYVFENVLEAAKFEIISFEGLSVEFVLRYGFDEFPNWEKELTDFPLEQKIVESIITDAENIIDKTWPDVNYNFPQIHTDNYPDTELTWETFEGTINNYKEGAFLTNFTSSGVRYNKNIIQPFPYLLHVLTVGFSDAGYVLKGDFIEHPEVKKLLVYKDAEWFKLNLYEQTVLIQDSDLDSIYGVWEGEKHIPLANGKKYRITGTVTLEIGVEGTASIFHISNDSMFGNVVYYFYRRLFSDNGYLPGDVVTEEIDFTFTPDNIGFLGVKVYYVGAKSDIPCDLVVTEVVDDVVLDVDFKNEIDLSQVVPDITFGDLITTLKKLMNISLEVSGTVVYMNFITNSLKEEVAFNLTEYEVVYPYKEPSNLGVLLFRKVDSETKEYLFFNYKGVSNTDLSDDNTEEIELDVVSLVHLQRGGVNSSYDSESSSSLTTIFLMYSGLNDNGINATEATSFFALSNLFAEFYFSWLTIRVSGLFYSWSFLINSENLKNLKKKIFAYGKYHIVKSQSRTLLKEGLHQVEIETVAIEDPIRLN